MPGTSGVPGGLARLYSAAGTARERDADRGAADSVHGGRGTAGGGYLWFAHDLRVPSDNNEAGQVIWLSKLIKVSGCVRPTRGDEVF